MKHTKECIICKKIFNTYNEKSKCCCRKCADISRTVVKDIECIICKNIFRQKTKKQKSCSEKCRNKLDSIIQKNICSNNINKQRLIKIGFKKGFTPWNKGKKLHYMPPTTFKPGRNAPSGKNHPSWKGGKTRHKQGYIIIRIDKKTFPEHRIIMEQHLGRKLFKNELVHHRNGIKDDNRIENLEIVFRKCHKGKVCCPYCRKEFSIR